MKRLILTLTAAVTLLTSTAHAQQFLQSWGLTYTNIGGVQTNLTALTALTNTVSQATNDFNQWQSGDFVLAASALWYTNNNGTIDPKTAYFKLVPSPDGVTWYDDELNTNNFRLPLACPATATNTTYAWKKFNPSPFQFWKVFVPIKAMV